MLSDFLALEGCYGRVESAQYIDEILQRYGRKMVYNALKQGHLAVRRIYVGPDKGRDICWLSDDGRMAENKGKIR